MYTNENIQTETTAEEISLTHGPRPDDFMGRCVVEQVVKAVAEACDDQS